MAGLAMETSKAEPNDRNQAKSKLNREAYVDNFPYVESYVDSNPYVESSVNRYAYVEVQLYLLLVASRTEKSDKERSLEKSYQE
ncbi:mucin-17-like [Dorcoceras hygrometricum]|uniref:Mucin-17-like n=1 Tax=Dorcoceras hygrometricum TaxID=472368 RepID=A0A2Z7CT65_9LAMI|nr:mucin-17-like [Dorcoceras hygrometricum]